MTSRPKDSCLHFNEIYNYHQQARSSQHGGGIFSFAVIHLFNVQLNIYSYQGRAFVEQPLVGLAAFPGQPWRPKVVERW